MKRKIFTYSLWVLTFLWLLLIFSLSSQNGEKTASLSLKIAENTARIIYTSPTSAEITHVHLIVRKLAHIVLFFALGILAYLLCYNSFYSVFTNISLVSILASLLVCAIAGFLDEWHKQFIPGRHFDLWETGLNIVSGALGAVTGFWGIRMLLNLKKPKNDYI